MIDDAVENGLSPGGCSAKLLQDHWCHPPVQSLQVETFPLTVCPAFGHFFSEKFLGYGKVRVDSVYLTSSQSSQR